MLKANIWTPGQIGKRPGMFSLHGGSFSFGSACELASQDGTQMSGITTSCPRPLNTVSKSC